MTKPPRKNVTDIIRLKSFVYWIGKALAELQSMTPETRQMIGEAMSEIDLPKITDLASLEKVLSALSVTGHGANIPADKKQIKSYSLRGGLTEKIEGVKNHGN